MNPVTAARGIVRRNSNALLLVVCLGQFMVILDVSIVNVALPSIKDSLGFSTNGLQWVLNAYTLDLRRLPAARRARGRPVRPASHVLRRHPPLLRQPRCSARSPPPPGRWSPREPSRASARAILSPATLAIITTSFDEGAPRNRALGAWGAVGAIGATAGVLLGGILTEAFSWPAIFVINIPVGLGIVLFSSRLIPEGRSESENRHFDLPGAVLVTLGMTALTYGIVTTDRLGWGALGVLGPVAAGVALLAAFGLYENSLAKHPDRTALMPLSVFRLRNLRAANLVIFLLYAAIFGFWFFQSLYMQGTLHYSALETGLAFVPDDRRRRHRRHSRAAAGAALRRAIGARRSGCSPRPLGELLLTSVHPGGTYLANVLPGGLLGAFGLGLGPGARDDRGGAGRPSRPEWAGLGRSQHLSLHRRSARAGRTQHAGRQPHLIGDRLRDLGGQGAHRRLPAPVRRRRRLLPGGCRRRDRSAAPAARARARRRDGRRVAVTRPLHFGAEGEARSDLCGAAACDRDLMAKPSLATTSHD